MNVRFGGTHIGEREAEHDDSRAGTGIAVGTAAPAAASESDNLRLKDSLTFLTAEQLLSEGYRACGAVHSDTRSTDAVNMVMNELGVSVNAALDIIAAAVVDVGC